MNITDYTPHICTSVCIYLILNVETEYFIKFSIPFGLRPHATSLKAAGSRLSRGLSGGGQEGALDQVGVEVGRGHVGSGEQKSSLDASGSTKCTPCACGIGPCCCC